MLDQSPQILAFEDFMEASAVGQHNQAAFATRINAWEDQSAMLGALTHPGAAEPLPRVADTLQRLFARRRSRREFRSVPLRRRQAARILAATGSVQGRRLLPSAGNLQPVHTYGFARRVVGIQGTFKYDHDRHGLVPLSAIPGDEVLRAAFQIQVESMPQLLLAFVVDPQSALDKYGERGGRFLLQEVGHAAQNVSIRLAKDRLRGYILGAPLDEAVKDLLGLSATRARVVTGFACGR